MEIGTLAFPRTLNLKKTDTVYLTRTPEAATSHGVLNIGDGPFDGISSGSFSGQSANGTYLAINAPTSFVGNLIEVQRNGSLCCRIAANGSVVTNGAIWGQQAANPDGTTATLLIGPSFFTGAGQFAGSGSGTAIAMSYASGYAGNFADWQVNAISQFKVSAAGLITARGIGIPDDLLALDWMQVA